MSDADKQFAKQVRMAEFRLNELLRTAHERGITVDVSVVTPDGLWYGRRIPVTVDVRLSKPL